MTLAGVACPPPRTVLAPFGAHGSPSLVLLQRRTFSAASIRMTSCSAWNPRTVSHPLNFWLSTVFPRLRPWLIQNLWLLNPLQANVGYYGDSVTLHLLSAPLTIPLVCCHINSFRPTCSCSEAMARRRKEDRRAGLASRGMCSDWGVSPPVCGHRDVPARSVVPDRCHASGAAVDARRDTPAWV